MLNLFQHPCGAEDVRISPKVHLLTDQDMLVLPLLSVTFAAKSNQNHPA